MFCITPIKLEILSITKKILRLKCQFEKHPKLKRKISSTHNFRAFKKKV